MTKQKGSILTKPDYDEIRGVVREEVTELTSNLPTKKEYFETSDTIIKELKALREDFAAHKSIHDNIEKDATSLKKKVDHLYDALSINPSF